MERGGAVLAQRSKEPLKAGPLGGRPAWSDARLVKACLAGDELAWSALIERYKRLIYGIAVRYRASPEDAADIFQSVCVDLISQLKDLRRTESLRSWLISVTAHRCLRFKERRQRREATEGRELDEELLPAVPPSFVAELEQQQMLREAIAQLPARCQEMVRLLFFHEPPLPYADVARRLGLATGSIGFIRGRCLKRLQDILTRMGF